MIEITGVPALTALLAPFVVLLIVIFRLRRTHTEHRQVPKTATEPLRAIPDLEAFAPGPEPPATATGAAPSPAAGMVAAAVPQPAAVGWAERVASAGAAGDQQALAGLYLSWARAEIADGRPEAAAGHLRESLRAGARGRDRRLQADARLELAELARAAGDLTTACEHWQIARGLFHAMSDEPRLGDTERLMRLHGCPTDWVLNDF